MNEETLKLNLIVPLLQTIGLDASGLSFETQFSIQLGHGVYNVKGDAAKSASGRSDILCRLNNDPLFIIEVKGEDEILTDADKRQGLSYARLLDPMAPFVLLTNGCNSKLFDTFSGKEIEPDKEQISLNGYSVDIATELNLRHEALRHFIGYSYENLCHYCRCHNENALMPFMSNVLGSGKKYIPSAYIPRVNIEMAFKAFLDTSGSTVLPIIGDSGVGKTNLLCHLVHSNPTKPFLFFSGAFLTHSIVQAIASSFNIAFSPQEQGATVLKKISALSSAYGEPFVLFLDAIDEWDAPDKQAQLNQLSEWFSQLQMKLVLSCKTQLWERFTSKNGIPTPLSERLFLEIPVVEEYSDDELNNAVKQYSIFFGVEVETADRYPVSHNPFALRIAFEVSQATNTPVNLSSPTRLVLAKYLEQRLRASNDPGKALRFLVEAAKCLLERDCNQIDEIDMRTDLGMRLDEAIPPEIFYLDILYRHIYEFGRTHIGFYFTTLRDHLIVTHVLRLAENPLALPVAAENGFLTKYIGESAFGYFFRTGSQSDQQICLKVAMQALARSEFHVLPRLLSWHGAWLLHDVAETCRSEISTGLFACFEASSDNLLLAEQIVDGAEFILGDGTEGFFTELFAVLLRKPDRPFKMVSSRIAQHLAKGSDVAVTSRLVDMAHHALPETGYIRRYIVESLKKRSGFDRRHTFLTLMVDPDPNVRTWVRPWYPTVEDVTLRDQLLQMFDSEKNLHVASDLVQALGGSQLQDTRNLSMTLRHLPCEFSVARFSSLPSLAG